MLPDVTRPLRTKFDDLNSIAFGFDLKKVIERYCGEHHLPYSVGERHARELLRYFVINELFPSEAFPMAGRADEFWHVFLLFTRCYADFSGRLSGNFLHHEPIDPASRDAGEANSDIQRYQKFLRVYEELYREPPPVDVWPRISGDFRSLSDDFILL